jgi:competence protein ComEA
MTSAKPAGSIRGYIALSVVWLGVLGLALFFTHRPAAQPIPILPPPSVTPSPTPVSSPTPGPWRVDVVGAVQAPGVYVLPAGSIVADAISAAGGPVAGADLDRLNKAAMLRDNTQVYVPRIAETVQPALLCPAGVTAAEAAPLTSGTAIPASVNINTASLAELDSLPGIGLAMAQRIIDGRPYSRIEDITRVSGIGETTLEKLRPHITVR